MRVLRKSLFATPFVFFGISMIISTGFAQDKIGLFFDPAGVSYCSEELFVSTDLYLIVDNFSHPDSLVGWELRIESDPGIFLTINDIYGQAMNIGVWPEFVVGLAEPLVNSNDSVLLAKFNGLAMNEGDLFILPVNQSSLPESNKPIYLVHGLHLFVEMDLNMPEEINGQAAFRENSTQPRLPESPSIDEYSIEGAEPFILDDGSIIDSLNIQCEPGVTTDFEITLHDSDVGFIGQVEDVQYKCLYVPGFGAQSLAFVKFKILNNYWGEAGKSNWIIVDVKVNRPENCVKYSSPHFDSFTLGDEYYVSARVESGRVKVLPCGIWLYENNTLQSPGGHRTSFLVKELLAKVANERNIAEQISKADFIAIVNIETTQGERDNRVAVAQVKKVIYGSSLQGEFINISLNGNLSDRQMPIVLPPSLNPGQEYLVLLSNQDDVYVPVAGVHSCLKSVGDKLEMVRGVEWGTLSLFESIVRGLK